MDIRETTFHSEANFLIVIRKQIYSAGHFYNIYDLRNGDRKLVPIYYPKLLRAYTKSGAKRKAFKFITRYIADENPQEIYIRVSR